MREHIKHYLDMEQAYLNGGDILLPPGESPVSQGDAAVIELGPLATQVAGCQKCPLHQTRTQTVFGEGDPKATLMFIGEGPGADEDRTGRPFVGRAGQLLTRMITAMGLSRETVYIANIIKCRPPQNRNPEPHEIAACADYLAAQIAAISPRVICPLGKFASQTILNTETPISRLRGKVHQWKGHTVIPTFHPAYLLRNPAMKKPAWDDLQHIMKLIDRD